LAQENNLTHIKCNKFNLCIYQIYNVELECCSFVYIGKGIE